MTQPVEEILTVTRAPKIRFGWPVIGRAWARVVGPAYVKALARVAPIAPEGVEGRGRLRESFTYDAAVGSNTVILTFRSSSPYAGFVIDGTAAHDIAPRAARALHWQDGHADVFARLVHHPGTKPNPFPDRARDALAPWALAALDAITRENLDTGGAL
jgi:hypothetical protein